MLPSSARCLKGPPPRSLLLGLLIGSVKQRNYYNSVTTTSLSCYTSQLFYRVVPEDRGEVRIHAIAVGSPDKTTGNARLPGPHPASPQCEY
jgi:hypothetical protein